LRQRTIGRSFTLSGIGIHSGTPTEIFVSPAIENSGIVFLCSGHKFPALAGQVKETRRGTTVGEIAITEHFLAAASALGIDNLQVEVRGNELPILDGSALPFVEALENVTIVEQSAEKAFLIIQQPIQLTAGDASLAALPYDGFKVDFMVNFSPVGEQRLVFELTGDNFKRGIAPARTFGYIEEFELLKEQGLGRGASFDNALVLSQDGFINAPRFPDELVRHKILDLIGDLALLGRPLKAEIKAVRSGHALNVELVRRLIKS
jgi:UDP-3-O-[3-hydroxymyristoyl] N-acetylglucosamine deacetylase